MNKVATITIQVTKQNAGSDTDDQFNSFLRDVQNYLNNRQMTNRNIVGFVDKVQMQGSDSDED